MRSKRMDEALISESLLSFESVKVPVIPVFKHKNFQKKFPSSLIGL